MKKRDDVQRTEGFARVLGSRISRTTHFRIAARVSEAHWLVCALRLAHMCSTLSGAKQAFTSGSSRMMPARESIGTCRTDTGLMTCEAFLHNMV